MLGRVIAVAAAASLTLPASAGAAACTLKPSSWVAGSVDLCDGALLYSDYVHDDYGADTGTVHNTARTASLAPTAGDEAYPDGVDATADLVRLALRPDGDRLKVEAELNALFAPDSTVIAVAIDSDANPATGGGQWGDLNVTSTGWEEIAFFDRGDPATNVIAGEMPLPPGAKWRVQAATAVRASGQVMNVAFRGVEEQAGFGGNSTPASDKGSWFEDLQAAALGDGDISRFGAEVAVDDLRRRVSRAQVVGPGLHERVYTSRYTLDPGEGVNVAGVPGRRTPEDGVALGFEQAFQYLGRYQPYGIYIPKTGGPYGMQMVFHGTSSVMSALINQPGMQQRFGEELDRVLVVPEARGENGFGSDISERDLLDVMADVEASYPIDSGRVFAGGYSQGGYITYRMASLYPHRFAGAVDWVGFTGDGANGTAGGASSSPVSYRAGAIGNVIDFVGNLRHVPTTMLYAGADELVHVWTAQAMADAFAATDNPYVFQMHPTAEHLTFAVTDDWRKEAAYTRELRLVRDPPRVSYRTATFLGNAAYGIAHDRAYWVSAIRPRGEGYADTDLTTHACGAALPASESVSGAGPDPMPWTSTGRRITGAKPLARERKLTGTLANVASLTVDTLPSCLEGEAFAYDLTTDAAVSLAFADRRRLALPAAGRHQGRLAAPKPRCARRRVITVHVPRRYARRLRSAAVRVGGKRVATLRSARRGARVVLRGRRATVRLAIRLRDGRTVVDTRRYRICTARR